MNSKQHQIARTVSVTIASGMFDELIRVKSEEVGFVAGIVCVASIYQRFGDFESRKGLMPECNTCSNQLLCASGSAPPAERIRVVFPEFLSNTEEMYRGPKLPQLQIGLQPSRSGPRSQKSPANRHVRLPAQKGNRGR